MRTIGKRTPITAANVEDAIYLSSFRRNRAERRRATRLLLQIVRAPIYKRRMRERTVEDKINETAAKVTTRLKNAAANAGSRFANGLRKFFKGAL